MEKDGKHNQTNHLLQRYNITVQYQCNITESQLDIPTHWVFISHRYLNVRDCVAVIIASFAIAPLRARFNVATTVSNFFPINP